MNRKPSPHPLAVAEPASARALRKRAEKTINDQPVPPPENLAGMSPHEMQRMIHELRVHQIQVEAQSEELLRQHAELVAAAVRNADLEESLRIKSLAFDLAINAMSIANPEGILTQANAAFLRIWGYPSKAEIIGKPIRYFLQDASDAAAIIAALNEAGCWEGSFTAKRTDGSSFIAHGLATVMRDEKGQLIGYQSSVLDITERTRMEAALRESEYRYRMLHESMMDAFVSVDMTGRILDFNPVFRAMLGYSEAELRRLTYLDITPEKWHDFEIRVVAEQILPLGYSDIYEKEYHRKDGTTIPVELRTVLIRDADGNPTSMWALVRDITLRHQAAQTLQDWNQTLERQVAERTEDLQQSEARFRQLAGITFEGIAISVGGRLVDGNPQFGRIHGYDLAEMIGRPVMDFIAPESRAKAAESLLAPNEVTYERLGLCKDGSVVPLEVHGRMGHWHGNIVRITAVRDLTESKRLAARIQAQQAEIDHVGRLALISEISASIIHQICQPISSLSTNLAVAMAAVADCELQRCHAPDLLDEIQKDVTRMREIVIHLRALTHPEQPIRVRTDLNLVVAEVLPRLQREAGLRQIRLETALAPDLPPLLADAVQLKQAVINLVRNAFDACADCPPPQRLVAITTRSLPERELELCVRDAGIGISPDIAGRLFEVFFTTKQEGHGLGLRLCRTIVHAHHGSIEARNNPDGSGATFRVVLPAES